MEQDPLSATPERPSTPAVPSAGRPAAPPRSRLDVEAPENVVPAERAAASVAGDGVPAGTALSLTPAPIRRREPAPPERPTPEPTRKLAPGARYMWTLEAAGRGLVTLLAVGLFVRVLQEVEVLPARTPGLLWAAAALIVAVSVVVVPQLRWRNWRYEVREQEIDLRRGAFTVRRTLVPMSRVQHVDTRRTPLSQAFGFASVVFHTAAGPNEIPALTEEEAADIRDRIADLAASSDDPV